MAKKPAYTESPRFIKEFVEVRPGERNNSNSLRRLLFDVVVHDFDGNSRDAAARFRKLLRDSRDRRKFRMHGKGLSAWTLRRVIDDAAPINFNLLDALAHHLEMPMGLLLLYSRIRSETETARGDISEARKILVSARVALSRLEQLLGSGEALMDNVYEELSHNQFEAFRQAYSASQKELRDTLL